MSGRGRFLGRTALVTGGGRGIGRAAVLRLAEEGAAVAIVDLDAEAAAEAARAVVAKGRTAEPLVADITEAGAAERLVDLAGKTLGPLDILVNNAAHCGPASLAGLDAISWRADFAATLEAAWALAMAAIPGMAARGRGSIVNVASVNALTALGNPAYSAAKAGLLALTRQIATEYGPAGIRCNAVSPGTVKTDHPSWQERLARDPEVFEKLERWYPVGRVGTPDDIAAAIAFLAADEAGFVNGANLVVDGGLTAGMAPMIRELIPGGH